jgi:succinoglycan biosynthesis protein ExoM
VRTHASDCYSLQNVRDSPYVSLIRLPIEGNIAVDGDMAGMRRTDLGASANLYPLPRIERVAVCVCTAFRPKMLEECLLSLTVQMLDPHIRLDIVVIDNEPEPNNREAVESIAYGCIYPMHYVHQPKRGIASARNAAIEKALELKADWICFIDDDETADQDWIAQLMHPDYLHVPVLMGAQHFIYPDPLPFWAVEKAPRGGEGEELRTAYTNNVRFSADIARSGLRFDESIGLGNGSDSEFFMRVQEAGWHIRRTLRAITHERAHPERLTYSGQIYRCYCVHNAKMRRIIARKGWPVAAALKLPSALFDVVWGGLWLAGAVVASVAGREAFRDAALTGGKKLATAAGRLTALMGIIPQPYRIVIGL